MENNEIILVSFNLKRDFGLPLKRSRRWRERRERAVQIIRNSKASVIGVQELSPSMGRILPAFLETNILFWETDGSRLQPGRKVMNTAILLLKMRMLLSNS